MTLRNAGAEKVLPLSKISTAYSEKSEKAHFLDFPISGIVVIMCSDTKRYSGEKSKFYEIGKEGGPAKSSAEVVTSAKLLHDFCTKQSKLQFACHPYS
jgi:hypothetical protein